MIRKSGFRFSEKIMLKQKAGAWFALNHALVPGRQDEATIREPGDLPSAVSTRQTRVGVYLWMIRKMNSLSVLARADGKSCEDRSCSVS
jgi:hypothetical protein